MAGLRAPYRPDRPGRCRSAGGSAGYRTLPAASGRVRLGRGLAAPGVTAARSRRCRCGPVPGTGRSTCRTAGVPDGAFVRLAYPPESQLTCLPRLNTGLWRRDNCVHLPRTGSICGHGAEPQRMSVSFGRTTQNSLSSGSARTVQDSTPVCPISTRRAPSARSRSIS